MVLRAVGRLNARLPRPEFRDERFVAGKYFEHPFAAGEKDGDRFAVEEVLSDSRDRKMERLSH